MAQAPSLSLSKFTATVQAAVKAAVQKHPKFAIDVPHGIAVAYLIRGIPVPDRLLASVTLADAQAFADDLAAHIGAAHPEIRPIAHGDRAPGAIVSSGRHVIIGIPAPPDAVIVER